MKQQTAVFLLLAVICSTTLASPSAVENHSLVRHRRQLINFEIFGNTRKLIEELIANLNKAAQQAKDAVDQFNQGLLQQAKQCRERFIAQLDALKTKVSESITSLQNKFIDSGSAVGACFTSHREEAEAILQDASQQTIACADSRIKEGGELVEDLNILCEQGQEYARLALAEMRNCTESHSSNILAAGACLGTIAVRTEIKGASFIMQTGVAIGRLNLFLSTLPAYMEVCAGSSLVKAGMGTARVLMDIGTCSTTSVLNNFGANISPITSATSSAASTVSNSASSLTGALPSAASSISSALPTEITL